MVDYPKSTVTYVAEASRDTSGGYTVTFPDLNGCITEGNTLKQAKRMAKDAMIVWLSSMLEDGLPLPEAIYRLKSELIGAREVRRFSVTVELSDLVAKSS